MINKLKHFLTPKPKPGITCQVEIEVQDKNGKIVKKIEKPSDSFTVSCYINLLTLYTQVVTRTPYISIRDINDIDYTIELGTLTNNGDWGFRAPEGDDNYGILVGTSNTPWSFTQVNLVSKIAHGSGAGQLAYGACTDVSASDSGTPAKVGMQRVFDNNSGADITVREIGWFGRAKREGGVITYQMITRDVITPVTVPNGGRLTVTYRILINPT